MSHLAKLYEKQISLTEWFEAIGDKRAARLREEDAHKHDRLDILGRVIGLPFGKPTRFSAVDVAECTPAFGTYLREHAYDECAIRLLPRKTWLPKLRIRGHTVVEAVKWFNKQAIDHADYDVDFVPHDHPNWATIFVIDDKGIYGEVKQGDPSQLTQGIYKQGDEAPTTFFYDYKTWRFSNDLPGGEQHVKELITLLLVPDAEKRAELAASLGAGFAHNYLKGYFETSRSDEYGIWFVDYNRLLGDVFSELSQSDTATGALVRGRAASAGTATGTVKVVSPDDVAAKLPKGTVLVCTMTTPDYLPLMQQAVAIVTDLGGVLSHAAIIARELKKPCVTGTSNATSLLKDGQQVTVDGTNGSVSSAN